jgi:hypothetical protein
MDDSLSAVTVYQMWKGKALGNLSPTEKYEHKCLALAAAKISNQAVKINFAIGGSGEIAKLAEIEFTIQPILIAPSVDGKRAIEQTGKPAKMTLPRQDNLVSRTDSGILAQPSFTIRFPANANGVEIWAKGLTDDETKPFHFTMSLEKGLAYGALGLVRTEETKSSHAKNAESESCTWFVGDCFGDCGPKKLFVSCNNNSPNLNCGKLLYDL